MIGLALGLGALGFFIAHRARHRAFHGAYGGGCGGRMHHRGWHDHLARFGGRGDGWLRVVSHHLDTTPAQERVIQREVGALVDRARDARRGALDGRAELARAMGGPEFDEAAATAGFAGATKAVTDLQAQAVEAMRTIHAVLDDEQRKELAELVTGGRWRFRGAGGPYR